MFFVCINCGKKSNISPANARWECKGCNVSGTLRDLMEGVKHPRPQHRQESIYNPRKERRKIKQRIHYLKRVTSDKPRLNRYVGKLESDLNKYLEYLESK